MDRKRSLKYYDPLALGFGDLGPILGKLIEPYYMQGSNPLDLLI